MNIRILKIIGLYILLLQFADCQSNDTINLTEILIATPVRENFVFSEENSDFTINGKKYWTHYKVSYENGNLVSFKRYSPEGPIEYSIEELKSDTAIYYNLNIPLSHKWRIYNNELYDSTQRLDVNLIRLNKTHFKEQNGRRVFIIK